MTVYEAFSNALAARGYHYDPYAEEFRRGQLVVDSDELLGLVRGMTLDQLMRWQDDKYEALLQRRARKWAMAFQHPDGRTIDAMQYHLQDGSSIIVWLTPSGDDEHGRTRHEDPDRRVVTTKVGECLTFAGQRLTPVARLAPYLWFPARACTPPPG